MRREPLTKTTELTRAILYLTWLCSFVDPILSNTPSQYEHGRWFSLEPARVHASDPDTISLRKLSNQLLIRLPRLIIAVKYIRDHEGRVGSAVFDAALELAKELLLLADDSSESELLHRLRIQKTHDPIVKLVVPYSFCYPDYQTYEAAIVREYHRAER